MIQSFDASEVNALDIGMADNTNWVYGRLCSVYEHIKNGDTKEGEELLRQMLVAFLAKKNNEGKLDEWKFLLPKEDMNELTGL